MKNTNNLLTRSLISTGIFVFITFYILFLVNTCAIQENTPIQNTIVLFLGFTLLVVSIFISFNLNPHNHIFKFWFISENLIKITLFVLMIISFFLIPPITFSSTIISWQGIPFRNLIRAVIFIIGCAFLPGSCLYNIIFPDSKLHEKFGVESFLLKITLFPLLSFILLGIVVLISDQLRAGKELITFILLAFIIILLLLDLISQKFRKEKLKTIRVRLTISKNSIIMFLISLAIITFAIGIMLDVKYLIPGDSWVGISPANYIGFPEDINKSSLAEIGYPLFWGYSTFALGVLSGIPFINLNVLLTVFLYIFVLSVYLFMKAILQGFREIYKIISTILTITFSGLLNIFTISNIEQEGQISALIFDGILNFRHKSFSYFLFFAGLALIFIIFNGKEELKIKKMYRSENFKILNLGAFFLVISYMTYMFPLLFSIIILFIYSLFVKNHKKHSTLINLTLSLLLIIIYFIIFDISMNFYLSRIFILRILYFFQIDLIQAIIKILPYWFVVYSALFLILIFSFIIQRTYFIIKKKRKQKYYLKFRFNSKVIFFTFLILLIVFMTFLILNIYATFDDELYFNLNNKFLFYYLNTYIIPNIGIIGILGGFFLFCCYKNNKNLFLILVLWITIIIIVSSLKIFDVFLTNFSSIFTIRQNITDNESFLINYWFTRTWFYVIPAISILLTVGMMKFIMIIKRKGFFKKRESIKKIIKNFFISLFIFLSITNLIVAGIYWQNSKFNVSDEEAHTIGWITNNIPEDSKVLIDTRFDGHLTRLKKYDIFKLSYTVEKACKIYSNESNWWWFISYTYDSNCNLNLINDFRSHQDVLKFEDQNNDGQVYVKINFNTPQPYGTIEYYILSTNSSNRFWGELTDRSIDGLHLWNGCFSYYNGDKYVQLQPYLENTWYHIILDFECTNGNYKGLDQYEWRVSINNTEYNHLKMFLQRSQMNSIKFKTAIHDSDWQVYLDIVNFSWYSNFEITSFIFNTTYMEEYLIKNNINYFIHTLKDTYYKRNVETEYLIIDDLINNYFPNKIFKYGEFRVYSKEI